MANNDIKQAISSSSDEKTSSSSSDSSDSTPRTPPSPQALPQIPDDGVVRPQVQNGRHSANGKSNGKSPKSSTPKSRLGAIDEDSDAISPDVPARNPLRKLGFPPMKFTLPNIPTLYASRPKDLYDDIEGPRGEKFSDVRKNKKIVLSGRQRWGLCVCLGCLLLIIAAAIAIGVIVGLRVKANRQKNTDVTTNTTDPGIDAGYPAGRYSIATYLDKVNTSCTSNPATWRCYPYETYSNSATASLSVLSWIVAAQNDSTYKISSADQLFSYTFQNLPMTLEGNGTDDEHWTFTYVFDKVVVPTTSITNDGSTARCFFNSTTMIGNLYTKKSKAQALQNATANGGNQYQAWPHAVSFSETHDGGAGVPNCYKYINGQIGEEVDIAPVSTTGTEATCQCSYTDTP